MYNTRIKNFFEIKGLSNKDIAIKIGVDEGQLSRWINADKISVGFLYRLIEHFPDIDLNYIIKEPKPIEYYLETPNTDVAEASKKDRVLFHTTKIEDHLSSIKDIMSQY